MGIRHCAVLLAACGRVGFDATTTIGHDEDGDGVLDDVDVCPHLADAQVDSDGDGIGDACDPEPAIARQHLLLFATLQAGDQPFDLRDPGGFTQLADAVEYDGSSGAGMFAATAPYANVRAQIGATILAVLGGDNIQHQVAMQLRDDGAETAHDFVEFNEVLPVLSHAQVSFFDGATFSARVSQPLPMHVHTGDLVLQATAVSGAAMQLAGGWLDEPYVLSDPAAQFAGGSLVEIDINHLVIDVRYVWAVAW